MSRRFVARRARRRVAMLAVLALVGGLMVAFAAPAGAAPMITISAPVDGGHYVTSQVLHAGFGCDTPTCTAENDGNPIASGEPLDTTNGTHTLTVTAIDGDSNQTVLTHTYHVAPNQNPVAEAGPNQAGKTAGQTVTLTAAGSSDPDGPPAQTLGFSWTQVANGAPTVSLSDASALSPTFTVAPVDNPVGNTYEFMVTVTDGFGGSASDTVQVGSVPSTPTVGTPTKTRVPPLSPPSTTFYVGDDVELSPGTITNPDGTDPDEYTYLWTQISGRTTALSDETVRNPTYRIPPRGDSDDGAGSQCVISLTGLGPNASGCPRWTVTITHKLTGKTAVSPPLPTYTASAPFRPSADAGANQSAKPLDVVTLSGSGSQQQGHAITYEWTQTGGPTSVTLSDPTAAKPTFVVPGVAGAYTFRLRVHDAVSGLTFNGRNISDPKTTTVNVTLYPLPVAAAGSDQTVLVSTPVQLDGSGSSDPNDHPVGYTWTQLSGTPVELSDEHAVSPTFTAPVEPSTLVFRLAVDDGPYGGVGTDDITINVYNSAPLVDAGASQSVSKKDVVTLHGSGSDPDGHSLTYTWLQVSGPPVELSDPNAPQPTFTAPDEEASLSFQLTVDDGHGGITSDSTSVTVVVIPGLNLQASTDVNFKPETAKSTFKLAVTNVGSLKVTVPSTLVKALITVNGIPVPVDDVVVESKSPQVAAGKTVKFQVTWNHGQSLIQLGDDIAVTECLAVLGDEDPDNNCQTWNSLTPNLNASVSSSLAAVKKGAVKNTIKVSVINSGAARISPIRDTDVSLTVSYGSGPAEVTRTILANPLVVALNPGEARNFAFVWDHPKLAAGTTVTVQACIIAPNNVSATPCTTYGVVVS